MVALILASDTALFFGTHSYETTGCPWPFEGEFVSSTLSPGDYVQFERTACYGRCPAYSVRIQADGGVHWQGRKFVAVSGGQDAKVSPVDAASLIGIFRSRGFWTLCSTYERYITDLPAWITTVRIGSHEKRVLNYAERAPQWLTDLDLKVDSLADTHRWRHGDPTVGALTESLAGNARLYLDLVSSRRFVPQGLAP